MCNNFSQARGEIMHEFSELEYNVRSCLAHLLTIQPEQPLKSYKKQFQLFLKFFSARVMKLNPNVLKRPDVQRMDAELSAAEGPFDNCLDRLLAAAEKVTLARIKELRLLKEELKEATRQRNILTHSIWLEIQGKIVMQNFPDYHKSKWIFIKGDGQRLAPQRLQEWTLQDLQVFTAHLRDLSERLTNLFQK
jgi:hypothetical protein